MDSYLRSAQDLCLKTGNVSNGQQIEWREMTMQQGRHGCVSDKIERWYTVFVQRSETSGELCLLVGCSSSRARGPSSEHPCERRGKRREKRNKWSAYLQLICEHGCRFRRRGKRARTGQPVSASDLTVSWTCQHKDRRSRSCHVGCRQHDKATARQRDMRRLAAETTRGLSVV